jgi:lipopolysaccharide/colanic/teichoic acid biosynthesis glycosyltransferase
MKRLTDCVLVAIGLCMAGPILVLIGLVIRIVDGGPVFFKQMRVGREGKLFLMYKFRTMRSVHGSSLTIGEDARITPLGNALRKFKLDELPQLLNVLMGQMSLVGPRPEIDEFVSLYTAEQRKVLQLTPGITDPASLKYISESDLLATSEDPRAFYISHVMPDKIRINLEYAKSATVMTDLQLIFKTIFRSFLT